MSWIRIEKPRQIVGYNEDNQPIAVLDLQVGTAADLPDAGDEVDGYIVAAGSCAQIVEADEVTFVTLSGDTPGWYPDQSGTRSLLASPTLKTAVERSNGDTIDLTEQELEQIRDDLDLEPFPEPIETKKEYVESVEEPEKDGEDDADIL